MRGGPLRIRLIAVALGVASSLVGALDAYQFSTIGTPVVTVRLMIFEALLKILTSIAFAMLPNRIVSGFFLFVFGLASLSDVSRFYWSPSALLLLTPGAFIAGLLLARWSVNR